MQHLYCPKCGVTISDPDDFKESFDCVVCTTPIKSEWAKSVAFTTHQSPIGSFNTETGEATFPTESMAVQGQLLALQEEAKAKHSQLLDLIEQIPLVKKDE